MDYKCALVLLSLLGVVISMNIKGVQPQAGDEQNVLYFEANDKSNSTCPNSTSYCSANLTCCHSNNSKIFGCCPILQGVCCNDGIHCCPPKTICDMTKGQCYMQNKHGHRLITADWNVVDPGLRQEHLLQKISAEVVCPGGTLSCPDGSTCCKSASGGYQCCPFPKALCCSDHVHCCPQNYKCNVSSGACTKGSAVVSWMMKQPAKSAINWTENSVVCPGGQSQCPDGTTCCRMRSGWYGCCPYPKAVCCSDGVHCCPDGYTCDVVVALCIRNDDVLSGLVQNQAVAIKDSVACKDSSECPPGNTCCKLASGEYGCCPL